MRRKKGKYGAVKVKCNGITFDSKAEYNRFIRLSAFERAGTIKDLKIHPRFKIEASGMRICTVELDFMYHLDGQTVYEDVKGCVTPMSRLKKKLVEAFYNIDVTWIDSKGRILAPKKRVAKVNK